MNGQVTASPLAPEISLPYNTRLEIPSVHLNLDFTLGSGQVFRWRRLADGSWQGPIGESFYRIKHAGTLIDVQSTSPDAADTISNFFQLEINLSSVVDSVSGKCPELAGLFKLYPGLRVCSQIPMECLLTFCCAVVTTIPRITSSIAALAESYGSAYVWGYSFPSAEKLAMQSAEGLRVGAMEFRCRSLHAASVFLAENGGAAFLESARGIPLSEARKHLTRIPHIGNKIADCVLLFSLGHHNAFPLDTHTWRMANRLFPDMPVSKSEKGYQNASQYLVDRLGDYAGWAQQYLYLASLNGITNW